MKSNIITIMLLTYNSDLVRIIRTIHSILFQKDVCFQLIIADDGSINNYFLEIERYLIENNFLNYIMIPNKENQGTVKNILSGIKFASGKYLKLISPGDFFYDEFALNKACSIIHSNIAAIYFGNSIFYSYEMNKINFHPHCRAPKDIKPYLEGNFSKILQRYLFNLDFCLGASFIVETKSFYNALNKLSNSVRYSEDSAIILMLSKGYRIHYMNINFIWYEFGVGISTSMNNVWTEKILKDIRNTYAYLLKSQLINQNQFDLVFSKNFFIKLLRRFLSIEFHLSVMLSANYSTSTSSNAFLTNILSLVDGDL